jgi:hypothetical protein
VDSGEVWFVPVVFGGFWLSLVVRVSSGEFWRVLVDSSGFCRVLVGSREFWLVLVGSGEF